MRFLIIGLILFQFSGADGQQTDTVLRGRPIATTVQLPTFGIAFDADGVLQVQTFVDPTGQLARDRLVAARAALPPDIMRRVPSRKVSLVRLEREILQRRQRDEPPTDAMRMLAGLTRITGIYCYPASGEIVIEGPAEGWMEDLTGRAIGIVSRRPTLLLDDLVVALRAYAPATQHRGFVGCTISPRTDGLVRLQQFQRKIPQVVTMAQRASVTPAIARGVRDSLGSADVQVFGIAGETHFAKVMIEADYRMKRIALGIEPPPSRKLKSFAQSLRSARLGALQRWWFTPAYDGVVASVDRLAMRLVGQGIQLQTEDKTVLPSGTLVDSRFKPSRAALSYANSFTTHYADIAAVDPVFAQLRQLVDLLIFAAFMRQNDWYGQSNWSASYLMDEELFPVADLANPKEAAVVVNAFWKANRLFVPAGGGVSIDAMRALSDDLISVDETIGQPQLLMADEVFDAWWWD